MGEQRPRATVERERRGTYEVTVLVEDHADVHVVVVEDGLGVCVASGGLLYLDEDVSVDGLGSRFAGEAEDVLDSHLKAIVERTCDSEELEERWIACEGRRAKRS